MAKITRKFNLFKAITCSSFELRKNTEIHFSVLTSHHKLFFVISTNSERDAMKKHQGREERWKTGSNYP